MRENLKKARKEAGMTQEQVEKELKMRGKLYKIIKNGNLIVCKDGTVYKKYRAGWKEFVTTSRQPYISIRIGYKETMQNYVVHRLIAEAFIPNPCFYEQVNHINGNTHDNRADNLEWCDCGYNVRDAVARHQPLYITNLRKIRSEYGYTISTMSKYLGILRGKYRDIENAREKPIPIVSRKLEEMFGQSIEYLLEEAKDE